MEKIKLLIKKILYTWIIAKEWKECGEFIGVDRIIVVGNIQQATIINLILKEKGIKVYCCTVEDFKKEYKKKRGTKWILLNKHVLQIKGVSSADIISMPDL